MAYQVIYYHDEPEDANTDSTTVEPISTFKAAVAAANRPPSDYWNGGASIIKGRIVPGRLGVRPDRWEDDESTDPWYVYDGQVQR